jgi:hypothetical protein
MENQSLAENMLQTIVMVVIALVLALIVMSVLNVHFRLPDPPAERDKPQIEKVVNDVEEPKKQTKPKAQASS